MQRTAIPTCILIANVNVLQVRIVGWGQHPPHWVVANTWGRGWGEQGLLRIRRGDNTARCRQLY